MNSQIYASDEAHLTFENQRINHNKRWTAEEKAYLIKVVCNTTYELDHISDLMRRSFNSLIYKLQEAHLVCYEAQTYSHYWNPRSRQFTGRVGRLEPLPTENTSLIISKSDARRILEVCRSIEYGT